MHIYCIDPVIVISSEVQNAFIQVHTIRIHSVFIAIVFYFIQAFRLFNRMQNVEVVSYVFCFILPLGACDKTKATLTKRELESIPPGKW